MEQPVGDRSRRGSPRRASGPRSHVDRRSRGRSAGSRAWSGPSPRRSPAACAACRVVRRRRGRGGPRPAAGRAGRRLRRRAARRAGAGRRLDVLALDPAAAGRSRGCAGEVDARARRASCRADGEMRTSRRGSLGGGRRARPGGGAGSPSSRMMASAVPTGTFVPGSTRSLSSTPLVKTSTSMSALSVSTSAMMSPRSTASPGCFSHSISVPALMSAPSAASTNSAIRPPSPGRRATIALGARAAPRPRGAWRTASAPRRCRRAAPASRGGRSRAP